MPDAHISLHTVSTVPLRHDSVYEVHRLYARTLDPLLVVTDLAEAEHVQIAFVEPFPQDAAKTIYVFWFVQHFLKDADIEAAHIQTYCARCASSGLSSAAAGERSADGRLRSATAGEHSAGAAAGDHSAGIQQRTRA